MIPRVEPEGVLVRKPVAIPDRVADMLFGIMRFAACRNLLAGSKRDKKWRMKLTATPLQLPVDGRQSETALKIARGAARLLHAHGFCVVSELPLPSGRRADLVALNAGGEIWIVEIKSSVADFRADQKWRDYRAHCDRLLFATAMDVPREIFPPDCGLMVADGYGAQMIREAPEHRLAAATRKAMMILFARAAALRLQSLADPTGPYGDVD